MYLTDKAIYIQDWKGKKDSFMKEDILIRRLDRPKEPVDVVIDTDTYNVGAAPFGMFVQWRGFWMRIIC